MENDNDEPGQPVKDFASWEDLLESEYQALEKMRLNLKSSLPIPILDEDDSSLIPQLQQLVRLGVLVVRARAGLCLTKEEIISNNQEKFPDEDDSCESDDYCDLQERRAFITCYVKRSINQKLWDSLNNKIILYEYDHPDLYKIPIERTYFGKTEEYMMANNPYVDLGWDQLNDIMSADYQLNSVLRNTKNKQNIIKDLVHLYIIDSEWGITSHLFDLIIEALKLESFSVVTEKDKLFSNNST